MRFTTNVKINGSDFLNFQFSCPENDKYSLYSNVGVKENRLKKCINKVNKVVFHNPDKEIKLGYR